MTLDGTSYWFVNRGMFLLAITAVILLIQPISANAVSVELGPIELTLKQGDEYLGSVMVANNTNETETVKIYLADWAQTSYGTEYYEEGSEYWDQELVDKSMTRWMRTVPTQVTLQPGESDRVYFEIKVPDDPTLSGTYWGIFFVERQPLSDEEEELLKGNNSLGIQIVVRHGVKVYVTIDGTDKKRGKFTAARTEAGSTGGLDFYASFINQGNTHLRPDTWLEIRNMKGETVYTQGYRKLSILPGITREYKFEMRDLGLDPGRYMALIIADYGVPTLVAAQAELEIEAS